MRLIDADELKEIHGMKNDCADCDKELRGKSRSCEFERIYSLMDFCGWLDDAPTIEPERKTGKWISKGYGEYRCSSCRKIVDLDEEILMSIKSFDYCPYCGSYNGG